MSALEFVGPPPLSRAMRRRYITPEIQAELDARPGEWAVLANAITQGHVAAVRMWCKAHPQYEVCSRGSNRTSVTCYVRRAES